MSQNTFACLSLIWAEVRQVAYAPSIHRMLTWHCVIKSWVSKTEKHKWIYSLSYKKILSSKGHTEIYIQRKNSISVSVFHPDSYVQIFPDSLYPLMRLWAGDAEIPKFQTFACCWTICSDGFSWSGDRLLSLAREGLWRIPLSNSIMITCYQKKSLTAIVFPSGDFRHSATATTCLIFRMKCFIWIECKNKGRSIVLQSLPSLLEVRL